MVSVAVVNGGSGYTSAPTVNFSSGGATATAVITIPTGSTTGSVSSVNLLTTGTGYGTTPPTISFSGGGGTGASAMAFLDTALPPWNVNTNIPMEPITTTNSNLLASADGSGYSDSRWMQLPIASQDGLTYVAAVRIIDNSSMINVNTATEAESWRSDASHHVLGETPADVNLERFLASANFNPLLNWGGSYTGTLGKYADAFNVPLAAGITVTGTAPGAVTSVLSAGAPGTGGYGAMGYLYGHIGYIPNSPYPAYNAPLTEADRLAYWTTNGQVLGGTSSTITPFGMTDEAELRLNAGQNGTSWSPLESVVDGTVPTNGSLPARIGPLRAAHTESGTLLTYSQYLSDYRRFLTTYNGTRPQRPVLSNQSVIGTVASILGD